VLGAQLAINNAIKRGSGVLVGVHLGLHASDDGPGR
jgi:hypothetical protein